MPLPILHLKKNGDRRLKAGHVWIYSNEIASPLNDFTAGDLVTVVSANQQVLGTATLNPHSLLAGRLFSRKAEAALDEAFFASALTKALQMRDALIGRPFYRLLFAESDGVPGVVIDRYGNHLVVQLNTAAMDRARAALIAALLSVLPETESLLLRNDSPIRQQENLSAETVLVFGKAPSTLVAEENGFRFELPAQGGQKTGWFYDHRLNRARLQPYVQGKRVLDMFSYLGAWGIHAAAFGADHVLCVDTSSLSATGIQRNAHLNGVGDKVNTLTMDAFDALKHLRQQGERFDVIILDPPAFAKKRKDLPQGLAAYQRLNTAAFGLLSQGGSLVSCSCSMQVSHPEFEAMLQRATWQNGRPSGNFQFLERGHQAPDHPVHPAIPETDYLKMVIGRKF